MSRFSSSKVSSRKDEDFRRACLNKEIHKFGRQLEREKDPRKQAQIRGLLSAAQNDLRELG